MAKKSKLKIEPKDEKIFQITSAAIKDDLCDYSYDIKVGIGKGDSHAVKGKGLIYDDLRVAFAAFNVHLAVIDDVFKHSGIDIKNVDKLHGHELTTLYSVTGFKIKGGEENESIILIGTKHIGVSGERMALQTPKIPLDKLSSYQWYNELKEAAEKAIYEVELYKGGKCTVVEESDEADITQYTIADEMDMQEAKI